MEPPDRNLIGKEPYLTRPSFAPQKLKAELLKAFGDPERPAYGQLASMDSEGAPTVRTVHFHGLPDREILAFSAHTNSPKWRHLAARRRLSGCYFDSIEQVQYRFSGEADLISATSAIDPDLISVMWNKIRPDKRTAYWLDAQGKSFTGDLPPGLSIDRPSPNIGVVVCRPRIWDIYRIHPEEYRKGNRTVFSWTGETWLETSRSILGSEQ